ncbi:hypothetical protein ABEW34_01935 [Paenibacillus algorifonticola]|uniref:hypothetical protein n=1 Tax=Paenibacillus algorifonticola TaxID=684063 RepID=UPI003D27593D
MPKSSLNGNQKGIEVSLVIRFQAGTDQGEAKNPYCPNGKPDNTNCVVDGEMDVSEQLVIRLIYKYVRALV